ncbi:MAG: tyrosine-type recombinase/integrase [Pseudonocardiales bacterium]
MGRHRLQPLGDRLQPRLRRRAIRTSAARHQDPPHLPRRPGRGQHATTPRSLPAINPTSHPARPSVDRQGVRVQRRTGRSVPWLPNRVTKMFIDHRRRAAVGQFRLHDLRHFMATEMLAHGVAIVTVSQRLGHARASTTLNVYGHCVPGADRDAADYIAELLNGK